MKFDPSLEPVSFLQADTENSNFVSKIKRLSQDSDTLVIGAERMIGLVEFSNEQGLVELKQMRGIHTGRVNDFVVKNERDIFSVGHEDAFLHKF